MAKKKTEDKVETGLRTIVCGPRDFFDSDVVFAAIEKSGFNISEIVSGAAKGVDTIGEHWAREKNIPVKQFVPDWNNITSAGAVVKTGQYGPYNAKAGFDRNQQMAEYAEAMIAIDDDTPGTGDMIERAEKAGLKMFIYRPNDQAGSDDKYLFYL